MEILDQIKEVLKGILGNNDQAFLYGSRARGTARTDSDWDILILLDKDKIRTEDYDAVSYPLAYLGWDINQIISPVLYTKNEWAEQDFTPFYANVIQEAKRLL